MSSPSLGRVLQRKAAFLTFRDALTGLWERFDPAQLATREAFRADPSLCWGWYEWRRLKVLKAQPNGAHLAIAELARHVPKLTEVTQNVDELHERAGNQDVIHLHGSLHSPRCIDCGVAYALPSRPKLCLRVGVELIRHDALHVMGMFDLESFGLVRCCPRTLEVQGSPLLKSAICSCRLERLESCIRLLSFRYERWGVGRLLLTSILCGLMSAAKSTFSKVLP